MVRWLDAAEEMFFLASPEGGWLSKSNMFFSPSIHRKGRDYFALSPSPVRKGSRLMIRPRDGDEETSQAAEATVLDVTQVGCDPNGMPLYRHTCQYSDGQRVHDLQTMEYEIIGALSPSPVKKGSRLLVRWEGSDEAYECTVLSTLLAGSDADGMPFYRTKCQYSNGQVEHDLQQMDYEVLSQGEESEQPPIAGSAAAKEKEQGRRTVAHPPGTRLRVWWESSDQWYECTVASVRVARAMDGTCTYTHACNYEGGEVEVRAHTGPPPQTLETLPPPSRSNPDAQSRRPPPLQSPAA